MTLPAGHASVTWNWNDITDTDWEGSDVACFFSVREHDVAENTFSYNIFILFQKSILRCSGIWFNVVFSFFF